MVFSTNHRIWTESLLILYAAWVNEEFLDDWLSDIISTVKIAQKGKNIKNQIHQKMVYKTSDLSSPHRILHRPT